MVLFRSVEMTEDFSVFHESGPLRRLGGGTTWESTQYRVACPR